MSMESYLLNNENETIFELGKGSWEGLIRTVKTRPLVDLYQKVHEAIYYFRELAKNEELYCLWVTGELYNFIGQANELTLINDETSNLIDYTGSKAFPSMREMNIPGKGYKITASRYNKNWTWRKKDD